MWRGKANILDARRKILESSSDLEEMLGHASVSISSFSHTSITANAEVSVATEAYLRARGMPRPGTPAITSTSCFFFRIARSVYTGGTEPFR